MGGLVPQRHCRFPLMDYTETSVAWAMGSFTLEELRSAIPCFLPPMPSLGSRLHMSWAHPPTLNQGYFLKMCLVTT